MARRLVELAFDLSSLLPPIVTWLALLLLFVDVGVDRSLAPVGDTVLPLRHRLVPAHPAIAAAQPA